MYKKPIKMNKKRISLSAEHIKKLANQFNTSTNTIRFALYGYTASTLSDKIRIAAKKTLEEEAKKIIT